MPTYVVDSPTNLNALASRARLALLRHLALRRGVSTGRELARAVGIEPKRAAQALGQLVEIGMVKRQRAGRAFIYSINDNLYLVSEALIPAFRAERRWDEALGTEVRTLVRQDSESVILYGSWARGTADASSDVDLVIVARGGADKRSVEERLAVHRQRLADRFARPVSLLVMDRVELRNRAAHGDMLVAEILEHGRVIAGKSFAELLTNG